MPDMTPERWERTNAYIRELFARESSEQAGLMARAVAAGLPDIDVGAESGRLLELLTRVTGGRLVIEVGTLAGYSAGWIAKGLAADGMLISVDVSSTHLDLARAESARQGWADRIRFRQGRGGEVLPKLLAELGEASADLVLLDAERKEYAGLLPVARRLLRVGGVLAVDNALAAGRWTADPVPPGETPDTMDLFNRLVADDRAFAATILPVGNGVLAAIRVAAAQGSCPTTV